MIRLQIEREFLKALSKRIPPKKHADVKDTLKRFAEDPNHPGLNFEKVVNHERYYTIRWGISWRILLERIAEDLYSVITIDTHQLYQRLRQRKSRHPRGH